MLGKPGGNDGTLARGEVPAHAEMVALNWQVIVYAYTITMPDPLSVCAAPQ